MSDFDGAVRALVDGSCRRILIALHDEDHVHPFSGDGDERNRAIQCQHVHLPLLEEDDLVALNQDTSIVSAGDDLEAVEPVLTALEARRVALPDGYLPEGGQTC